MTRFWRDGHWRTSQSGITHWVEGHWVDRDVWDWNDWERDAWQSGRRWTRNRLDDGIPNATCPVCGEEVWFYRNPNGGCAYFDDLGWPWPKHPCMDTRSVDDRTAVWQAVLTYREAYEVAEPDDVLEEVRAAFEKWQEARSDLGDRSWEWDIQLAEEAASAALDEMLGRSRTSASLRKKREKWTKARALLPETRAAYEHAKERAKSTREEYLRLLEEHY